VEETSGHSSSLVQPCCDTLTDIHVDPFLFAIAYVDPNIAGKRVGETNTQLFSWQRPGDDDDILPIVTSIVIRTILWGMYAAIAGVPDFIRKIWQLAGCLEEPNEHGGPQSHNITRLFDTKAAAGLPNAAMKLYSLMHFCLVYHGQHADGTSGAQMPMCGGSSYHSLDDIFPPSAEYRIYDIGEESDDDAETWHPNPTCFPTT